ncbi:MAG: GTPase [Promethearchaeota archaeon]
MANKAVILGRAGVGKTSLINIVFKGKDPEEILKNPPAPTRGVVSSVYNWFDLELGMFDTSGQELPDLLVDEDIQYMIFQEANAIIYVFNYEQWVQNKEELTLEIKKIYEIGKKIQKDSKFFLIFHKIDKIGYKIEGIFDLISENIINQLRIPERPKIFFSSIQKDILYTSYNTFASILSSLSPELNKIKKEIDPLIESIPKTICIITNNQGRIILQSMSLDFNLELLHKIHRKIYLLSKSSKSALLSDAGSILIDSNSLSFSLKDTKNKQIKMNKIFLFSDSLKKKDLDDLLSKIKFPI